MPLLTLKSRLASPGKTVGLLPLNYRRGSAGRYCSSCAYGPAGGHFCSMWWALVAPDDVCDRWEAK